MRKTPTQRPWLSLALGIAVGCRAAPQAMVIEHVTVVDVTTGTTRPDQSVLIAGDRITSIAPAAGVTVPRGATRLDGRGRYLIPGLWDMHVHVWQSGEGSLPVLVANGVTGARDMGGDYQVQDRWRRRIAADSLVGPQLILSGPRLDGPPAQAAVDRLIITTEAQATKAVDSLAALGVDFLKVYEGLPREAFFAIARAARAKGLAFGGHVPFSVTAAEASDSGMGSIEHIGFIPRDCLAVFDPQAIAAGIQAPPICRGTGLEDLFRRFAANRTWLGPTLVSYRGFVAAFDSTATPDSGLAYVNPALRERWREQLAGFPRWPVATWRRLDQWAASLVARIPGTGASILAGTDLGNPYVYPGRSLHDELERLVATGYPPAAALRAATSEAARFLGVQDSLGTAEAGKVADLVLLEADPLANIGNTRRIAAVVLKGRLYARPALDSLLARARAQ